MHILYYLAVYKLFFLKRIGEGGGAVEEPKRK